MSAPISPDRWMRLRHPSGFDAATFDAFCASAEILGAHATALLRAWHRLPHRAGDPPVEYTFFAPELSEDRTVASLPIGGASTLGTRAAIENGSSYLLWRFLPTEFVADLEEGLTETVDRRRGPETSWRKPAQVLVLGHARMAAFVDPRS